MRKPNESELSVFRTIADAYMELERLLPRRCGLRIMLSPLVIEPRVLFVGINPAPWPNMKESERYDVRHNSGREGFKFDKESRNEKIRLLVEQCFREDDWLSLKGIEGVGHEIVFVNYTPFYTRNLSELRNLENSEGTKNKERQLIHELIGLIRPKNIICAGTKGCYLRLKSHKGLQVRHIANEKRFSDHVLTARYDGRADLLAFSRIINGFRGGKQTRRLVQQITSQMLKNHE